MSPVIPSANLKLSYGVYACDFDPQDATKLIVGGGGGASKTGVGNKITVIDTSSPNDIRISSEIDLDKNEDSVMTLVAGQRKGRATLVYAGINSSAEDIRKGKNDHFRVFGVDQPSRTRSNTAPKITELARSSLLAAKDPNAYQRLLRISSPSTTSSTPQVGAVATGMASNSEIAVFDVSPAGSPNPKVRGRLELTRQASDLDIIQVSADRWQLLYCDDYELFAMDIGKGVNSDPAIIFTMPHDESSGAPVRPSFRAVRYLTPHFVLAASNLPKGSGALLQAFRLPVAGQAENKARIATSTKLPGHVARATALAVQNLSPVTTSPAAKPGDAQFVVAVAGQDSSVTLYTLDHQSVSGVELIANLHPFASFKAVHPTPITDLAFSHFASPPRPTRVSQSLKLASVGSMGNTVVVHTIPLQRYFDKSAPALRRGGPPRPPRYVVALKSQAPGIKSLLVFSAIVAVVLGALLQGALEIQGFARPVMGVRGIVPASWLRPLPPHYMGTDKIVPDGMHGFLAEHLAQNKLGAPGAERIVLSPDAAKTGAGAGVKVESHDQEVHTDAKEWDQLPAAQQAAWKARLKSAGHWGEEMGDTIFKGVLFSEIAGAIGQMVGG